MSDSSSPATPVLDVWCELQCPDCRGALDDLRALRARYGDRLELRLRHFPLEKHKHAFAAAQAAEEALEQGRAGLTSRRSWPGSRSWTVRENPSWSRSRANSISMPRSSTPL